MKRAPGLAGRDPPKRGNMWPIRFRPLLPMRIVRPGRQTDRATRGQVWFDVGQADVALAAVAGDIAVRRDCTENSSGAVSKAGRL